MQDLEAVALEEASGKIATCSGSIIYVYRPYGKDEGALRVKTLLLALLHCCGTLTVAAVVTPILVAAGYSGRRRTHTLVGHFRRASCGKLVLDIIRDCRCQSCNMEAKARQPSKVRPFLLRCEPYSF